MAGRRLNRRTLALAALALLVLALHLWLARGLHRMGQALAVDEPEPARLSAAFVRTLVPKSPSVAAVPPPAAPPPPPASTRRMAPLDEVPALPPDAASAPLRPEPDTAAAGAPSAAPPSAALDPLAHPPELQLPEEAWQPGAEWPLSTELQYQLTGWYRGQVHGQARVQWLRDGAHYQVHLEVQVGPSFAPLLSRRMSSDGVINEYGISPRRFDEVTTGLLLARRQLTLQFERRHVRLPTGLTERVGEGVQDASSQFVHLSWLFLTGRVQPQPGVMINLPLALPQRVREWRYEVTGEQDLQTPLGPLRAWHLRPAVADTRGDWPAEVWLAPSLGWLPVRIRIWHDDKTHIDLMLRSAPLQAAPGLGL